MKTKVILFLLVASVSLSACSRKILFNTEVRSRIESNNIPLTKLQYYVDRNVEFKRVISTGETKVSSGTIKVENGKQIQIIKLKKNTPGICTTVMPDRMVVTFDEGPNKNLVFVFPRGGTAKSSYILQVNEVDKNGNGKINYDGKVYAVAADGVRARLKVKKSTATKLNVKKTKMKGRKVS